MASLSVAKVAILQLFYVCMHVYACVCVNAHECASTCVHAHRDQRTASAFTLQAPCTCFFEAGCLTGSGTHHVG